MKNRKPKRPKAMALKREPKWLKGIPTEQLARVVGKAELAALLKIAKRHSDLIPEREGHLWLNRNAEFLVFHQGREMLLRAIHSMLRNEKISPNERVRYRRVYWFIQKNT